MTWEKLQLEIYLVPGADVYGNRPSQHEIKMSEIFSALEGKNEPRKRKLT